MRLMIPLAAGYDFDRMKIFSVLGRHQRSHHAGFILLNYLLGYELFKYPFQGTDGFSHDLNFN